MFPLQLACWFWINCRKHGRWSPCTLKVSRITLMDERCIVGWFMWRGKNELRQLWVLLPSTTQQGQKWIQIVRYAHKQQTHMRAAHVDWQHLIFRMTVIPHGVTEQDLLKAEEWQKTKRGMGHLHEKTSPADNRCFKAHTFRGLGTKRTDAHLDTEGIIQRIIQMEREKGCQEAGRGDTGKYRGGGQNEMNYNNSGVAKCAVGWLEYQSDKRQH